MVLGIWNPVMDMWLGIPPHLVMLCDRMNEKDGHTVPAGCAFKPAARAS